MELEVYNNGKIIFIDYYRFSHLEKNYNLLTGYNVKFQKLGRYYIDKEDVKSIIDNIDFKPDFCDIEICYGIPSNIFDSKLYFVVLDDFYYNMQLLKHKGFFSDKDKFGYSLKESEKIFFNDFTKKYSNIYKLLKIKCVDEKYKNI